MTTHRVLDTEFHIGNPLIKWEEELVTSTKTYYILYLDRRPSEQIAQDLKLNSKLFCILHI